MRRQAWELFCRDRGQHRPLRHIRSLAELTVFKFRHFHFIPSLYSVIFIFKNNCMLYSVNSKVGRENLVSRYLVPLFSQNFRRITCWVAELNTGPSPWRLNINNNLLSWGSNPQPSSYSHIIVPLRHPDLSLYLYIYNKLYTILSRAFLKASNWYC